MNEVTSNGRFMASYHDVIETSALRATHLKGWVRRVSRRELLIVNAFFACVPSHRRDIISYEGTLSARYSVYLITSHAAAAVCAVNDKPRSLSNVARPLCFVSSRSRAREYVRVVESAAILRRAYVIGILFVARPIDFLIGRCQFKNRDWA